MRDSQMHSSTLLCWEKSVTIFQNIWPDKLSFFDSTKGGQGQGTRLRAELPISVYSQNPLYCHYLFGSSRKSRCAFTDLYLYITTVREWNVASCAYIKKSLPCPLQFDFERCLQNYIHRICKWTNVYMQIGICELTNLEAF